MFMIRNDSLQIQTGKGIRARRVPHHASPLLWPNGELPLRAMIATLNVIMRVIAIDGTYLFSEGGALAQIGRAPGDIVGQSIYVVLAHLPDVLADMRRALAGETLHTTRDVNGKVWESRYSPLYEGDTLIGTMYVAMDVTARVRVEEALRESETQLRHQATHDALTGLLNRTHFLQRLTQTLADAEPGGTQGAQGAQTAVLFLDLDGFKHVNDRHGHAAGDAVLTATAERLQKCVRLRGRRHTYDAIGRLGGDEFIVLLVNIPTVDMGARVAARVATALAAPIPIEDYTVHITASIGIALSRAPGASAEAVIYAADAAMYTAKRTGVGQQHIAIASV